MRTISLLALFFSATVLCCGEIETVVLPKRPSQTEFPAIQESLLAAGCGLTGCHSAVVGNFQVTPEPKPGPQFESEFLLTKSLVDLRVPENSKLLTISLPGHPDQSGHPACYSSVCSCAYQAIYRWIGAIDEDDFVPDEQCTGECEPEDGC